MNRDSQRFRYLLKTGDIPQEIVQKYSGEKISPADKKYTVF